MKVLYLVASNINYFDKTFPFMLQSIPKNKRDKFVIVVNGNDKRYIEYKDGIKIVYVTDNSFEYSPLIDLIMYPNEYETEFIFLITDTCSFGKEFFNRVENPNSLFETIAVDSLNNNIGWLRKDFLLSKRDFIFSMKNCTREKRDLNRGKLFKIALSKTTIQTGKKIYARKKIYGDIYRITEWYDGIDLYKYKAK